MWRTIFMGCFFYTGPLLFLLHGLTDYYTDYWWSLWDNEPSNVYDFIIIGAGSAGATIAYRLSKHHRVLLVEAGGHPFSSSKVPGIALDLTGYPHWDWMHKTIPQKHAGLGLKNNVI
ncbi:unnamed protein product [Allacma fusca]|uniref:FAD dependent oxidoreductase domain-containing protein n=1 Tax=Allacma fusca TaxID=39272 RepID=A0A8J2JY76_9HEXA|nr:unnamed protein product [Allacma fusca]